MEITWEPHCCALSFTNFKCFYILTHNKNECEIDEFFRRRTLKMSLPDTSIQQSIMSYVLFISLPELAVIRHPISLHFATTNALLLKAFISALITICIWVN